MKLPIDEKAVARVKDKLPVPETCRYCGSPVELARHEEIYDGRSYGDWPYVYLCQLWSCGARVGLHRKTNIPLGILASQELRQRRTYGKGLFMLCVEEMFDGDRSRAYAWLAACMGIDVSKCHWGWFDEEQVVQATEICFSPGTLHEHL